jgi:hypothetical protein
MKRAPAIDAAKARRRSKLLLGVFALGALALEARFIYLQHFHSDFLNRKPRTATLVKSCCLRTAARSWTATARRLP